MINVEPGFVLKTKSEQNVKIFINFCHSDKIRNFSKQIRLDDDGNEQEGLHIPLSIGEPHEESDKKGDRCVAYDVAINPDVIKDCREDQTGTFRNFLCELAMEYVEKKYQTKLDRRYKLPKLQYRGTLPPKQHYVRKEKAPKIEQVNVPTKNVQPKKIKQPKKQEPHSSIKYELYEGTDKALCRRVPSVEGGSALSPEILAAAPDFIQCCAKVNNSAIQVALGPEYLELRAETYFPVDLFLPYPVLPERSSATFDVTGHELIITMPVNREWATGSADPGSNQWLLMQALDSGEESQKTMTTESVVDRFHLKTNDPSAHPTDPVDDDEELPEDKFHQKDMVSQHILIQRREDRLKKEQEADEARKQKRKEYDEKLAKATAAGKSWSEMYPKEPETTFIDFEELKAEKKVVPEATTYVPSEAALSAAAAWSEEVKEKPVSLSSSLAFELLD